MWLKAGTSSIAGRYGGLFYYLNSGQHIESEGVMEAVEVKRDEYGFWTHPEYFEPANGNEYGFPGEFEAWLYKHNLECNILSLECDDQAGEVAERYGEGQLDGDISEWQPTKPDGNGWFIGSIHDTEDGPYCIWLRSKQAA